MKGTSKRGSKKSERLTITLAAEQRRQVAAIAHERRTSEATVIRWAVDKYVADNAPSNRERSTSRSR